jgi:predicted DNA-binding transcriptional regulator YafY
MRRADRLDAAREELRRSGTRGCTARHLADQLGVSLRTVRRDLEALMGSGFPVWAQSGPGGGYFVDPAATLPPITLTAEQVVGLHAAVHVAGDIPFRRDVEAALAKLEDALPASVRQASRSSRSLVWVDHGHQRASSRARTVVEHATLHRLVTRITFVDARGTSTRRDVEPQALAYTRGTWYLLAWCRLRAAPRWFVLDRITRADATTEPVVRDCLADFGEPPPTAGPLEPAVAVRR